MILNKTNNIKDPSNDKKLDATNDANLKKSEDKIKNDNFYKFITKDKKNTDNKTNLILLKKIGKAYYEKKLNIPKIKKLIN